VFCTAHFGNWEMHALGHSVAHGPVGVVARPLDNPLLDARLVRFRTRTGNTVIYKHKALAQVIRLLREGRNVAFLLDQNVQAQDGIFVEFFGRPAATTTVAAALALKTGAALVTARSELRADGVYELVYEAPIEVDASADREAEIRRLTQIIAARTEAWIRARPEQWLWMHRRWKTQPAEARA
jgi:KDO2-lipid IV(A) lauroyltransferase